jgi:hypothetical protein
MAILDRARRGQHDLSGVAQPLASVLEAALAPDPLDRPLLDELLAWLRPLSTTPGVPKVAPPGRGVLGPETRPLVNPGTPVSSAAPPAPPAPLAAPAPPPRQAPDAVTSVLPEDARPAAAVTRMEQEWDAAFGPPDEPVEPVGFGEKLRRAGVVGAGALAVGASIAAAPWISLAVLLVLVWLLRAGSLTASAVADRRTVRGRKWYDGPRLVVTSPWHGGRAVGGTLLLMLLAVVVGLVVGLVGYVVADLQTALFLGGAAAAIAVWIGPGSDRFRGPVARLLVPAARGAMPCMIVCCILLGAAAVLALLAKSAGADWAPGSGAPFGL